MQCDGAHYCRRGSRFIREWLSENEIICGIRTRSDLGACKGKASIGIRASKTKMPTPVEARAGLSLWGNPWREVC